jgi:hypothetical protein
MSSISLVFSLCFCLNVTCCMRDFVPSSSAAASSAASTTLSSSCGAFHRNYCLSLPCSYLFDLLSLLWLWLWWWLLFTSNVLVFACLHVCCCSFISYFVKLNKQDASPLASTWRVGNCYLSQCFVSLHSRQQHNYFQFCLSKIPLLYRYFCIAQQQDLFLFLIITLYYEYQLGAETA